MKYVVGCDLGTGGNKAVLVDESGLIKASSFDSYQTWNPKPSWHEQSPDDWVRSVALSTARLLEQNAVDPANVLALGLSGHSLGLVPIDVDGDLLLPRVPIWSDGRAGSEARKYFQNVPWSTWYGRTGNGFPPPLYPIFKAMWLARHEPATFRRTAKILGSKDYVNYRLTGQINTDPSYASGSGLFNLRTNDYDADLVAGADLAASLWPEPIPSSSVVGRISHEMAPAIGLLEGTPVVAGGVDNAVMALGARNTEPGRVYNSLGSSAWIAYASRQPIIDERVGTYVFAHVIPGMYTSAVSIFSAGTTLRWLRGLAFRDLDGLDADLAYETMMAEASESPVGARGLIMNPTIAGGTTLEGGPGVRGGLLGLDAAHTRGDMVRAALEGIGFALGRALSALRQIQEIQPEMLVVGGGSQSELWRQILADIYDVPIVKTSVGLNAAALGAAALALKGADVWDDLRRIDECHQVENRNNPMGDNQVIYEDQRQRFERFADLLRSATSREGE